MKIKGNSSNFEPCPEYTGKGVCVDVTPLRKQQSQYGERNVFKLVFEVDRQKEDGTPFAVWSTNFTPTLNEKASLRKFLRGWFGRDLAKEEMADFDTEILVGKPAQLVVVHQHKDGEVYANIAACTPDKSGAPLKASGRFVRAKDRAEGGDGKGQMADGRNEPTPHPGPLPGRGGEGASYRRAEQPGPEDRGQMADGRVDHGAVKVHVGKYKGIELRDLNIEAVQALAEKWLPTAAANPKPSADDKRLSAALEWWKGTQEKGKDNLEY